MRTVYSVRWSKRDFRAKPCHAVAQVIRIGAPWHWIVFRPTKSCSWAHKTVVGCDGYHIEDHGMRPRGYFVAQLKPSDVVGPLYWPSFGPTYESEKIFTAEERHAAYLEDFKRGHLSLGQILNLK
jgi:hypothetical protein